MLATVRDRVRQAAHLQLGRVDLSENVLLEPHGRRKAGAWIVVHDRESRTLVGEVRLVDPVVDRLAEVDHPEQDQQEDWHDERELRQ